MLDLFSVCVVIIRSLAILIILNVLTAAPAALFFISRESYPDGSSSSRDFTIAIAVVAYGLLSVFLLIFAEKLVGFLTRGLENTSLQVDESNLRVLQAVAFSLLGAYVLVYSIPTLIKMAAIAVIPMARDEAEGLFRSVGTRTIPIEDAIQELIKAALGFWLLFGQKRIVFSARTMWKKHISADTSE